MAQLIDQPADRPNGAAGIAIEYLGDGLSRPKRASSVIVESSEDAAA
jgi:hypothetical protein